MYRLLRPILFLFAPECAHHFVLKLLKWFYCPSLAKKIRARFPKKIVKLWGLEFPNPVGLAAGFDKNGECIDALLGLGFGFIEVGAVTPKPQPGNPKPRLFRLPRANALINRMGFNNLGVDYLVSQLKKRKIKGILGVNIGKNKDTPLEKALDDYRICFEKVYPYADFVTINISSPNTPGLRELQMEMYLHDMLNHLKQDQRRLADEHLRQVPLLLKISPDLTMEQVEEVAHIALNHRIEGIVAVNTTLNHAGVKGLPYADEKGGLSGQPLLPMTLRIVERLHQILNNQVPIIAVGGIVTPDDAASLFNAGASLVQVYTGLIYRGPRLIRDIVNRLAR